MPMEQDTMMPRGEGLGVPRSSTPRGEWATDAMCKGMDQAIFFIERGGTTRKAAAICAACHVAAECLDYARRSRQPAGIWGGIAIGAQTHHPGRLT